MKTSLSPASARSNSSQILGVVAQLLLIAGGTALCVVFPFVCIRRARRAAPEGIAANLDAAGRLAA